MTNTLTLFGLKGRFGRTLLKKARKKAGREEGEQKKALMIAKAMLEEGATLDFIQRVTQLPMRTIEEIKRNQITG